MRAAGVAEAGSAETGRGVIREDRERRSLKRAERLGGDTPSDVETDFAGVLLVAAGDNPERLSSEAAFARLYGVAPLPASSGKTNRHRLNRGGDRIANNALWRIVMVRMSTHRRTANYVERRIKEDCPRRRSTVSNDTWRGRSITVSRGSTNNRSIRTELPHGTPTCGTHGEVLSCPSTSSLKGR